jgi:murein DD-endopeptidase MepM/ murein hydrolase activator NlpD
VSVSSLARRALLATAAAVAVLGLAPTQAQAVPETAVRQEARAEVELAIRMAERTQALADLNRRADVRDRAIAGERAVLAKYGYVGDVDAVEVVLPLASYDVSAAFGLTGPHWESIHGGQDFSASTGETLVAVADAVVTEVADAGPYGLRTILTLADGTEIWYCHQTSASVTAGETVEVAQPIGNVGSTGNSTGPHLHLEVRPGGGDPVDPMTFFRSAGLAP